MASLIIGGIGGYLFGPIGFAIGSALGSLLDPQKTEGPRMQDKHLQGSSYGEPIPIVYGTMRLSGQVIWTTELQEHKNTSGGKGGPEITTYSYSASFDVLICESPVVGVLRIWADSTLIYDATGAGAADNSAVPVTIYLGGDDQQPDPTEEAELGVGNVPAYRGICRCVFNDWDLGTWGNRIPQLSFEVFTKGGDIPWRVSTFSWTQLNHNVRQVIRTEAGDVQVFLSGGTGYTETYVKEYQLDGTQIGTTYIAPTLGAQINWYPSNLNVLNCRIDPGDSIWYTWDADNLQWAQGATISTVSPGSGVSGRSIYKSDYIYAVRGSATDGSDTVRAIYRFNCLNKIPGDLDGTFAGLPGALTSQYSPTVVFFGVSNDDYVWVIAKAGAPGTAQMWKFDTDLVLVKHWTATELLGTHLADFQSGQFMVYNGIVAINRSVASGTYNIALTQVGAGNTLTDIGVILSHGNSDLYDLGDGFGLDTVGVFSLNPPALPAVLGEIVADISDRVGLDVTQYPDLPGSLPQTVPGYLIPRQSTGRDNLLQLRTAYFWDAVESSAAMKFVNRGGPSVLTIDDNDLAAQAGSGGTPPPLVTVKRAQEVDLPATMYVVYFNPSADYQNNTQYARRLVTQSEANARVDLSISLEDETASSIANKLLYAAWVERVTTIMLTSRQFAWYEPTDVVTAHGYVVRITGKSFVASNVVQFDGVATNTGVFVAGPVPAPGSGFNPPVQSGKLPTALLLLDIPLVLDTDMENGAYAGMAGATDTSGGAVPLVWPGAALNKSDDAGASYASVGTLTVPTVMGLADNALGDFAGGNIFDESNTLSVTIGAGGGELASASELSVLDGANMCVVGLELLQFKNATLTAPGAYDLTGLLRGRRGTEWAMAGHVAGERFALLPGTLDYPLQFSELSLPRIYKPVTIGRSLAVTDPTTFTSLGAALQPYAPVSLGGGSDDNGDTTLQWIRRTRKGGAWQDYVDVPVSEASEQFIVQIWDSSYALCARIITVNNDESTIYTNAQQVTDFGAAQETVYFTVGQIGAFTLGSQARGTAAGSGSTDDQPLTPIPPYSSAPGPAPGPTNPVNLTLAWNGSNSPSYTSGLVIGDTFVVQFTTDANPLAQPNLGFAEYGDPPTYRTIVIATDSGGTNVLPRGTLLGTSGQFIFGVGAPDVVLSALTTYYVVIKMQLPNGQPSGVLGDPCDMVIGF